jgi:glycosyltransferase involved in cell wall biosynthesis
MARILLITNIFPPLVGGPATFIDRLAHHLSRKGHIVTVLCSSDAPNEVSDAARPFRVVRVSLRTRELYEILIRVRLFWLMLGHTRILVNGLEPYVAEVTRFLPRRFVLKVVGDTVWETARNRGTTVSTIDEFQLDAVEQHRNAALIEKRNRSLFRASQIVTPSEYLRRMVIGWGIGAQKVAVVNNGVDIDAADLPITGRAAGTPLRVLFVGRLTNWKGIETLLLALKGLDSVQAHIVGDGPAYPHLQELAMQLGIASKVVFTGRRSAGEVRNHMQDAHVLVLVSLYEGMSHTLLEACSLGLPVIASKVGGNEEVVVDDRTGILVPPREVTALRRSLERLRDDENFRISLGLNAKAHARGFSIERTVAGFAQLLDAF